MARLTRSGEWKERAVAGPRSPRSCGATHERVVRGEAGPGAGALPHPVPVFGMHVHLGELPPDQGEAGVRITLRAVPGSLGRREQSGG